MRYFIIGDVHGCYNELRNLVSILNPKADDKFIFVGDIVDKGYATIRTIRYISHLLALYPGSVCVAGNHESKALERYRKGTHNEKGEDWYREAMPADWDFLREMPLYHRISSLNILVVHGGMFPRFFNLYPDGLDDAKLLGQKDWQHKGGKYVKRARRMQYIRCVDPTTGDQLSIEEEKEDSVHWASVYDGREGLVFYGHSPSYGTPRMHEHAIGLDTGVSIGMCLTAAVVRPCPFPDYGNRGKFDLTFESVGATNLTIQLHREREKNDHPTY